MDTLKYTFVFLLGIHLAVCDYERYAEFIREQAQNETFVRLFNEHLRLFEDRTPLKAGLGSEFHCEPYPQPSGSAPKTVHELRPMDVKVIGALGDSITAGTGIKAGNVLGLLKEDRGLSWSIGGDKTVQDEVTLANMLKTYSSDLKGYSTGWGPVWLESSSQLNVANPGDKAEDMPGQAVKLVDRMKKNSDINFDEDWKVITLFIGGNDLCDFCNEKEKYSAENYVKHIQEAVDYLHANVPRAFVNLVEILDIAIVKALNANFVCDTLHLFLCDCAAFPKDSEAEKEMRAETERYRKLMYDMVMTGRYDTRKDFTVVVQPFFERTVPPQIDGTDDPDLSYFAPDCFHLSLKGHRAAADALWNNMIEPAGNKRTVWTPGEKVECPSATAPYFFTYKNSGNQHLRSNDLGAPAGVGQEEPNKESNNPPVSDSHPSSKVPFVVVVTATVAILAIVGTVVLERRFCGKTERHLLLRPAFGRKPEYTSI